MTGEVYDISRPLYVVGFTRDFERWCAKKKVSPFDPRIVLVQCVRDLPETFGYEVLFLRGWEALEESHRLQERAATMAMKPFALRKLGEDR